MEKRETVEVGIGRKIVVGKLWLRIYRKLSRLKKETANK